MPDITMCQGEGCPIKMLCYRYTATPDEYRQSYFVGTPWDGSKCEHFSEDTRRRSSAAPQPGGSDE